MRWVPVVLAIIAVLSLGAAAATLDTARQDGFAGDGEATGPGDGESFSLGGINASQSETNGPELPRWLVRLFVGAFVVFGLAGFAVYLREAGLTGIATLLGFAAVIAVVLYGLLFLLERFGDGERASGGFLGGGLPSLPGGSSGANEVAATVREPSTLLAVALVILLVLAVIAFARATGDSPGPAPDPDTDDDTPDRPTRAAVGAAAGRAADRIEGDAAVENAVYRAWREMTDHLELPRETTTAGEFATAAVDAGMREADVAELTDLFEAVRYGGHDPSEADERRAIAALRRIERAYAGVAAGDAADRFGSDGVAAVDADPGHETDADRRGGEERSGGVPDA